MLCFDEELRLFIEGELGCPCGDVGTQRSPLRWVANEFAFRTVNYEDLRGYKAALGSQKIPGEGKQPVVTRRGAKKRGLLRKQDVRWAVTILAWTFALSMGLSATSSKTLEGVGYGVAFLVLLLFVFLGILFDIIGIGVATASEKPFHSMSSRRVSGAQEALWLIRRADKVSNFCNDVVGDICGIISGTTSAVIAVRIAGDFSFSLTVTQLIVSGLVAAVTVGGKAICKGIAMNHNVPIVHFLGRILRVFFRLLRKNPGAG